jgi:hypothetical protein
MAMELTFGKVVTYLLSVIMLVVLVGGIVAFTTPLGNGLKAYVEKALNLGTQPVAFTGNEEVNTATSSVNALLYAINKVAWYDTYKPTDTKGIEIRDMSKKFLDAEVTPLIEQREMLLVGDRSEVSVLPELVRRVVDCKKIYDDKGGVDSQCFTLDFTGFDGEISEDEFSSAAETYIENGCIDNNCKSILKDILGKKFLSWQKNYVFELKSDGKISNNDKVKICAQDKIGSFMIHITDSDNVGDICKLPEGEYTYGMKVVNFELPQDVDVSPGLANRNLVEFAKKYTNTYGDPEYIMYYETFPEGEDAYWKPSSYVVDVVQILTVEGIFLAIDLIPFGKIISKTLKKIPGVEELVEKFTKKVAGEVAEGAAEETALKTIGESKSFIEQLKSLLHFNLGNAISNFFRGVKDRIITKILGREVIGESVEASAERTIRELAGALPAGADTAKISKLLAGEVRTLHDLYVEAGDEIFDPTGKFTPEFRNDLAFNLKKTLSSQLPSPRHSELIERMTQRITSDLSDKTLLQSAKRSPVRFFLQIADSANEQIPERLKVFFSASGLTPTAEEREKAIRLLVDKLNNLDDLTPYQIRKLTANRKQAVQYALEMQDINPDFAKRILGSKFPDELVGTDPLRWTGSQRSKVSELLDSEFELALKDVDWRAYRIGKTQAFLFNGDFPKARHLITAAVVYSNALEDSLSEKFVPVGTNAIGLRTPFLATTIYDDTLTQSFNYNKDKQQYVDFFKYYAGYTDELGQSQQDATETKSDSSTSSSIGRDEKYLGYRGLLPEVNRYYLSLVKDKGGLNSQDNQRLHLASPCKADIFVTKTICECWGSPKEDTRGESNLPPLVAPIFEHQGIYVTGTYNEFYDQTIENFDKTSRGEGNKMLYTIGSNGDLIKECYPRNLGEHITFWEDAAYKPSCIEIDPVLREVGEGEYNYCYHGKAAPEMIAADVGLNYALPIVSSILCTELGPPGMAICGFVGGAGGGLMYSWLNTGHQWPNHN